MSETKLHENSSSFDDEDINQVPRIGNEIDTFDDWNEKKLVERDGSPSFQPAGWTPPDEWLARFIDSYTGEHSGETLPPGADVVRTALAVFTMNEEDSLVYLKGFLQEFHNDYTINTDFQQYIRDLVLGHEHCQLSYSDWAYETSRVAGVCDNWSPYAEVRAVLLPYDDPGMACETLRAYVIASFWTIVGTFVNVCEYHRVDTGGVADSVNSLQPTSARYRFPRFPRPAVDGPDGPWGGRHSSRLGFDHLWSALHPQPRALDEQRAAHGNAHDLYRHWLHHRTAVSPHAHVLRPAVGRIRLHAAPCSCKSRFRIRFRWNVATGSGLSHPSRLAQLTSYPCSQQDFDQFGEQKGGR